MALINCKECGNSLSDRAAACPHCGMALAGPALGHTPVYGPRVTVERTVGVWLGLGIFLVPLLFVWFLLRKGHSTLARVIGFAWLAVMLIIAAGQDDSPARVVSRPGPNAAASVTAPVASAPKQPLREYSAQQLTAEYERNTVAADQQFKGQRFKVSGVVESINTDLFGNPYVTLKGGVNPFMEPQFVLDDAHTSYAAGLHAGMRIRLICTGRGDVAKTPMSDECVPAN